MMRHPRHDELHRIGGAHEPLARVRPAHAYLEAVDPVAPTFGRSELAWQRNAQRLAAGRQPPDMEIPERRGAVSNSYRFDQGRRVAHVRSPEPSPGSRSSS